MCVFMLAVGVIAIIGGVCSLNRKGWVWALTGAVCAVFVWNVLGIPAVVFVVMGRGEFGG